MGDYNKLEVAMEIPTKLGAVKLGRLTGSVKAKYENWLEGRARQRVFDLRETLGPQNYKESMKSVQEECAAGTFSWGGDAWRSSLQQLPGIVKIGCLLTDSAQAGQGFDEEKLIEIIVDESQEAERIKAAGAISVTPLTTAIMEAMSACPNFLAPPMRGARD